MSKYWLSCDKFTVLVEVDDQGIIRHTAPIVRKFIGQKFENLLRWMERLGHFQAVQLFRHTTATSPQHGEF